MTLPIVFHPDYVAPLKPGHRFPMSKYGYLREVLIEDGLLPASGGFIAPGEAGFPHIAAVHDPAYVDRVFSQNLSTCESRVIGLPDTIEVTRRARLSCAGTLLAARWALDQGIACNAAGGSHHAGPDGGAGYCVFNDVAVAALSLLDEGRVGQVLVIDLDVHQGDGTARIFADTAEVFTCSVHAAKNFPTRKACSDHDLGLPDAVGDREYLELLGTEIPRLIDTVRPDIVFYNAGVDIHERDRLGRLALSDTGIRARDQLVINACHVRNCPVTCVLGGGYDDDIRALAGRHGLLFHAAAEVLGA